MNDSYQTAMKSLSESPQSQIMVEIYQHSRERLMRSMTARRDFCLALSNAGLLAQGESYKDPWVSSVQSIECNICMHPTNKDVHWSIVCCVQKSISMRLH